MLRQKGFQQRQHPAVGYLGANPGHQGLVRDRVKIAAQIDIDHVGVTRLQQVIRTPQGVLASSVRTEAVAMLGKVPFEERFQHVPQCRLDDPVAPGDTVTLRFTIDNVHPTDDATNTFFTDSLSAVLSGLAATGPATLDTCGGTLSSTTLLTYTGGSVASGNACTIEVPVLVPAAAADGFVYQKLISR